MAGVALTALDWPRWRAGVRFGAVAVSVAGVASSFTLRGRLGDIDLHFACLCGESLGGGGVALGDIDLLCVAGVALGDIHLHFAWQAWRHRPPHFAWTPVKRFARVMEQTPGRHGVTEDAV